MQHFRSVRVLPALVPLLVLLGLRSQAAAAGDHVPGQLLVKAQVGREADLGAALQRLIPDARIRPALGPLHAARLDTVGLSRILLLETSPGDEAAALARLAGEPSIEWAEYNGLDGGITGSLIPNDPAFPMQWALSQPSDIDMDVPEAWAALGTMQSDPTLIVAVIDTGYDVSFDAPDWQGVIWDNPLELADGIDNDGNGLIDDLHGWDFAYDDNVPDAVSGHGVWTGGIIGALTDNGAQVAGIASGVTIMPLKAFDDTASFPTSGPYAGHLSAAVAITYATDHGALLLNDSWGNGATSSSIINDALQYAVDNGVHPFFSAGNSGGTVGWPAQNPIVTAVAAIDEFGLRSIWPPPFPVPGASTYGTWVDLCAAGTGVATTGLAGTVIDEQFGFFGTSASCPQATGVAALLLGMDRDLTPTELRAVLMQGAVSVDALNPGFEGLLGAGHVNAEASVALLAGWSDLGQSLPGTFAPRLNAWGLVAADAPITLSLSHAPPLAPALLVAGFGVLGAPFKGGVLVPTLDIVFNVQTSSEGTFVVNANLPAGLPSGPLLRVQLAVADSGAPKDVALSNAVLMTVP